MSEVNVEKRQIEEEALAIVRELTRAEGETTARTTSGPSKLRGPVYAKAFYRLVRRGLIEQTGFHAGRKQRYALASELAADRTNRVKRIDENAKEIGDQIQALLRGVLVDLEDGLITGNQLVTVLTHAVNVADRANTTPEGRVPGRAEELLGVIDPE